MRALITSLAAVGLAILSLSGFAACGSLSSPSRSEQQTCLEGDDFSLKSTSAWSKPGRTADEDSPLKPSGATGKPARTADEEKALKSAGASSSHRSGDDEQTLKPSGASSTPGRKVEEITPLRSTGGVTRPARIEDDGPHM